MIKWLATLFWNILLILQLLAVFVHLSDQWLYVIINLLFHEALVPALLRLCVFLSHLVSSRLMGHIGFFHCLSLWCDLKWPNDFPYALEHLVVLHLGALEHRVYHVLNTDASTVLLIDRLWVGSQQLFNEHVVRNCLLLGILSEEAALSHHLVHRLERRVPIANVLLNRNQFFNCISICF